MWVVFMLLAVAGYAVGYSGKERLNGIKISPIQALLGDPGETLKSIATDALPGTSSTSGGKAGGTSGFSGKGAGKGAGKSSSKAGGKAARIVEIAKTQIGAPYVWGDINPIGPKGGKGSGFDCSGFTSWVFGKAHVGPPLPHMASIQQHIGKKVSRGSVSAGDLVFYNYGRKGPGVADHVAIAISNDQQIAASSSADRIAIQSIDNSNFIGARRLT